MLLEVAVNAGGLCFVIGDDGNDVNEYLLGTEYDISTASFVDSHVTTSEDEVQEHLLLIMMEIDYM